MAEPISFTYELLDELGEDHQLGCKCCRFNKGVSWHEDRSSYFAINLTLEIGRLANSEKGHRSRDARVCQRFDSIGKAPKDAKTI